MASDGNLIGSAPRQMSLEERKAFQENQESFGTSLVFASLSETKFYFLPQSVLTVEYLLIEGGLGEVELYMVIHLLDQVSKKEVFSTYFDE